MSLRDSLQRSRGTVRNSLHKLLVEARRHCQQSLIGNANSRAYAGYGRQGRRSGFSGHTKDRAGLSEARQLSLSELAMQLSSDSGLQAGALQTYCMSEVTTSLASAGVQLVRVPHEEDDH